MSPGQNVSWTKHPKGQNVLQDITSYTATYILIAKFSKTHFDCLCACTQFMTGLFLFGGDQAIRPVLYPAHIGLGNKSCGTFVPWDVLSMGHFVRLGTSFLLGHFVRVTFCLRMFCLRMFCLRMFCLRMFCLRTFCLRMYCLRMFCLSVRMKYLFSDVNRRKTSLAIIYMCLEVCCYKCIY